LRVSGRSERAKRFFPSQRKKILGSHGFMVYGDPRHGGTAALTEHRGIT
jgi:hypothetical protein